jgi:hypothetical protein
MALNRVHSKIQTFGFLAERSLRGVKSKLKISGQFQSEETAGHYAAVKSYIETCPFYFISSFRSAVNSD